MSRNSQLFRFDLVRFRGSVSTLSPLTRGYLHINASCDSGIAIGLRKWNDVFYLGFTACDVDAVGHKGMRRYRMPRIEFNFASALCARSKLCTFSIHHRFNFAERCRRESMEKLGLVLYNIISTCGTWFNLVKKSCIGIPRCSAHCVRA